jgi:hypothetical protein
VKKHPGRGGGGMERSRYILMFSFGDVMRLHAGVIRCLCSECVFLVLPPYI